MRINYKNTALGSYTNNNNMTKQQLLDEFELLLPPGATILEYLAVNNKTPLQLAIKLNITTDDVTMLLLGKIPVTPELAEDLERELWGSKEFWLNLEENYRKKIDKLLQSSVH